MALKPTALAPTTWTLSRDVDMGLTFVGWPR